MDEDRVSTVSTSSLSSFMESIEEEEVVEVVDAFPEESANRQNIVLKLLNRETMGFFANSPRKRIKENPFKTVPSRLSFVLKEIIPAHSMNEHVPIYSHVFMGLTQCGKFLLSYKMTTLVGGADFFESYLYKLYFWIFIPNKPLTEYHHVRLFDLSCNMRHVTIVQWPTNPRYVIVVGTEYTDFSLDSMITIVSVPKIGCSECKILRDVYADNRLCTHCNLTIHMRCLQYECDPDINLVFSLACPNKIIVISSGQIHAVDFIYEPNKQIKQLSSSLDVSYLTRISGLPQKPAEYDSDDESPLTTNTSTLNDNYRISKKTETKGKTIVEKIIADFADSESESSSQGGRFEESMRLIGEIPESESLGDEPPQQSSSSGRSSKHSTLRSARFRNLPIRMASTPSPSADSTGSSSSSASSASTAYEFSEDTENCEKISTFRKRRLADKRYEFSEDNSENIIPFAKIFTPHRAFQSRHSPVADTHSILEDPYVGGRGASGSHVAARSSCTQPARTRNRFFQTGRRAVSSSFSICSNVEEPQEIFFLRRAENREQMPKSQNASVLSAIQPLGVVNSPTRVDSPTAGLMEEKPTEKIDRHSCSKKFVRVYVDQEDAKYVTITDEVEPLITDDSPGLHSCLPLEVRGSNNSEMRMISEATFAKLKCPGLINAQNTFDLDSFTMIVADDLCKKNQKRYGLFYDWACEIITVCPLSKSVACILMVHFTARDLQPNGSGECAICCSDCLIHVKHYQCRILFTWDTESGEWNVLNAGELVKVQYKPKVGDLGAIVKKYAQELMASYNGVPPWNNVKILDSYYMRSKTCLTDNENAVEFRRHFDADDEFSNSDEH